MSMGYWGEVPLKDLTSQSCKSCGSKMEEALSFNESYMRCYTCEPSTEIDDLAELFTPTPYLPKDKVKKPMDAVCGFPKKQAARVNKIVIDGVHCWDEIMPDATFIGWNSKNLRQWDQTTGYVGVPRDDTTRMWKSARKILDNGSLVNVYAITWKPDALALLTEGISDYRYNLIVSSETSLIQSSAMTTTSATLLDLLECFAKKYSII